MWEVHHGGHAGAEPGLEDATHKVGHEPCMCVFLLQEQSSLLSLLPYWGCWVEVEPCLLQLLRVSEEVEGLVQAGEPKACRLF